MNKNRLFTALAALATVGGVAVAAAPATSAATAVPRAAVTRAAPAAGTPTPTRVVLAGVPSTCTSPGTKYSVAQSGINIRQFPGGPILHPISKTATFLSRGPSNNVGITCKSNAVTGGTRWVYGVGKANRVHGWIGLKWLKVLATGPGF